MIRIKDIKLAINTKILSCFNMMPTSIDITEGFERPSFFVDVSFSKKDMGQELMERDVNVIIYYFPEEIDTPVNDIIEIQEELETLFDSKLQVGNRFLNINETQGELIDKVLQFSFNLNFIDTKDYDSQDEGVLADEILLRKEV